MPDKPNPFRNAINARNRGKETEDELPTPQPEVFSNESAEEQLEPTLAIVEDSIGVTPKPLPPAPAQRITKKRGRPSTGKRSDADWIGRTFYVKRDTDLDVEELLVRLRRQGIEIDKSELVEMLLAAWVKWHKGKNLEIQLSEISPIQKSKNRKADIL